MRKRILGLVLTAAIFVTIFPVIPVSAVDVVPELTTSEQGLALIKRYEGLSKKAYYDAGQWTIGYGMACNPADYPNGITEPEADKLLREGIGYFEDCVNRFAARYGIALTQNQFDALVSITFNLGPSWINSSYRFWTMLREGVGHYTDNQVASALGVWCHVGESISTGLIERRMAEIRVFLYGDYNYDTDSVFSYIIFDGDGGNMGTDILYYRKDLPYAEFTTAERKGYYFAGWYTARSGGSRLTGAELATTSMTLYARWSATPVTLPPVNIPAPTAVFADVKSRDWFSTFVTDLHAAGIIKGYSDGTFRPNDNVTTGQALKMILLAAGRDEQAPTAAHWASGYQSLAVQEGILDVGDVTDLNAPANRQTIAKIVANALGVLSGPDTTIFSDTDNGYVVALYQAGVISGSVDASGKRMFYPLRNINRAEISKIVWMVQMLS